MLKNARALAIFAGAAASALAPAAIIYNNFDGVDGYSGSGWTISGGTTPSYFQQGFSFTSLVTGNLGSITVSLNYVAGPNAFTLNLWSDASGLPGSALGSWAANSLPAFGASPTVISTPGGPLLSAGTKYWLTAQAPTGSGSWASWAQTNTGASSTRAFKQASGDPWSNGGSGVEGGMRLQTAPVPEPITLVVLGFGAVAAMRRKRA
jgi:hypothetical protein